MKMLPMKVLWKIFGVIFYIVGIIYFILLIFAVLTDNNASFEFLNSYIFIEKVFDFIFFLLIFLQLYNLIYKLYKQGHFLDNINNINVENVKEIKLHPNLGKEILIKTEKLKKIILYVLEKTGKKEFKKGELDGIYKEIIFLNKRDLSKEKYEKIKLYIKKFVDEGGKVEVIKK